MVIGAGAGGLAAALELAGRGFSVTVVERASAPGGKIACAPVGPDRIDAGPTVLTMLWVFEELFERAGASLREEIALEPLDCLARHVWPDGGELELWSSEERSADAIGDFAGAAAARGYRAFRKASAEMFETLDHAFIRQAAPSAAGLARHHGPKGLGLLWRTKPFTTLWRELARYFSDPRLVQLFGRYATYVGSSPFEAPATLMLIAHVEQCGVWAPRGGLVALAETIAALASRKGARFRYGETVARIDVADGRARGVELESGERLEADAVVLNGSWDALAAGFYGERARAGLRPTPLSQRSLSAATWAFRAKARGPALARHNVFFSADYAAEFRELRARRRAPLDPTVYLCAQARSEPAPAAGDGFEPMFCLINAPATGDLEPWGVEEIEACRATTIERLERSGLSLEPENAAEAIASSPRTFEARFPGTGGALYGLATHGAQASFRKPTARARIERLYLAGGGAHPGAGVPMATLSGQLAANCLTRDLGSIKRSRRAAIGGGTSTG